MKKFFLVYILALLFFMNTATANDKMLMKLEAGEVEIQLFPDIAPEHVKRIKT